MSAKNLMKFEIPVMVNSSQNIDGTL